MVALTNEPIDTEVSDLTVDTPDTDREFSPLAVVLAQMSRSAREHMEQVLTEQELRRERGIKMR